MPKQMLITTSIAAIVSAATSYGVVKIAVPEHPPIAVIDYGKAVASLRADTSDEEREDLMAAVDTQRRKLAAAGFLVLNSNAVLASPASMEVPVPTLMNSAPADDDDGSVADVE